MTGSFRRKYARGELEFTVIRDNDCNTYGDYGYHIYQMIRGIRPERPHATHSDHVQAAQPHLQFSYLSRQRILGLPSGYALSTLQLGASSEASTLSTGRG